MTVYCCQQTLPPVLQLKLRLTSRIASTLFFFLALVPESRGGRALLPEKRRKRSLPYILIYYVPSALSAATSDIAHVGVQCSIIPLSARVRTPRFLVCRVVAVPCDANKRCSTQRSPTRNDVIAPRRYLQREPHMASYGRDTQP